MWIVYSLNSLLFHSVLSLRAKMIPTPEGAAAQRGKQVNPIV